MIELILILAMVFPGDFTREKNVLLVTSLLFALFKIVRRSKNYQLGMQELFILAWMHLATIAVVVSHSKGFPTPKTLLYTLYFTPIISWVYSRYLLQFRLQSDLNRMLRTTTWIIVFINIAYVLQYYVTTVAIDLPQLNIFGAARETDDLIEFRVNNQIALMYLGPFIILSAWKLPTTNLRSSLTNHTLISLIVIIAFFSGRRALQLSILVALFIASTGIVLSRKVRLNVPLRSVLIFVGFVAVLLMVNQAIALVDFQRLELVKEYFVTSFTSDDASFSTKREQGRMLVNGYFSAPIFGNGAGAYLRDLIRNHDEPWSYELVYHALLFQFGVPIVIFAIGIFVALGMTIHRTKSSPFLGALSIATVVFLLVGATNPMIYYFWFWTFTLYVAGAPNADPFPRKTDV